MALKSIRLELARDPEFPEGSARHGYEFKAPLDKAGHIDAAEWKKHRQFCAVRRFWGAEDDEYGHVIRTKSGGWAFHYDIAGAGEDEPGYRFQSHGFKPGEYVSITEHDGRTRTFKVVSVK
jgi:hypothetical protein